MKYIKLCCKQIKATYNSVIANYSDLGFQNIIPNEMRDDCVIHEKILNIVYICSCSTQLSNRLYSLHNSCVRTHSFKIENNCFIYYIYVNAIFVY